MGASASNRRNPLSPEEETSIQDPFEGQVEALQERVARHCCKSRLGLGLLALLVSGIIFFIGFHTYPYFRGSTATLVRRCGANKACVAAGHIDSTRATEAADFKNLSRQAVADRDLATRVGPLLALGC